MQACTVPILIAALGLAGCGAPQPTRPAPAQPAAVVATPATVKLVRCDDGGSGGVMIDGVCL